MNRRSFLSIIAGSGGSCLIPAAISRRIHDVCIGASQPLILAPDNPFFPASGPTQWLFQGPPAERKFLAANLGKAAWRATLAMNENRREISRFIRLPARTGDFSYRNTAH